MGRQAKLCAEAVFVNRYFRWFLMNERIQAWKMLCCFKSNTWLVLGIPRKLIRRNVWYTKINSVDTLPTHTIIDVIFHFKDDNNGAWKILEAWILTQHAYHIFYVWIKIWINMPIPFDSSFLVRLEKVSNFYTLLTFW